MRSLGADTFTPQLRGWASKVFCLVVGEGQQYASLSVSILNTVIFFLYLDSWLGHSPLRQKCVCVWFLSVCLCVYLGATLEMPRHVCFALFILLYPTLFLPLLASSSGPSLIQTDGPLSFDSMWNKTLMEMSLLHISITSGDCEIQLRKQEHTVDDMWNTSERLMIPLANQSKTYRY